MKWIIRLYSQMLRLYPPEFQAEFGEEMTAVFTQAMMARQNRTAVILRELHDLPLNLAREHWHSLTKKELPMTTIHRKPEWYFYPAWIILTAISIPIAFILSFAILRVIITFVGGSIYVDGVRRITEDWLAGYVFFPLFGLVTGLLQYLLLRRYLPRMGWWAAATALGWPLAAVIVLFLRNSLPAGMNLNNNWFMLLIIFLVGGLVGLIQWLVLRPHVPHAGWWIPATIGGWMAVRLAAGEVQTGPLDIWYLAALPAISTAVTLAFLINQSPPPEPQGYTG